MFIGALKKYLPQCNTQKEFSLLFVGSGWCNWFSQSRTKRLGLEDKVLFVSRQPMEKLRVYTSNSDFGLSLDKDSNLNYRYSLPNKLFDYIQAEIPVLASDLPEIRKIVDGYSIGEILRSHEPRAIADQMMQLAGNSEMRAVWKQIWKKHLKNCAGKMKWTDYMKFIRMSSEMHAHIVSFDVPYPADYGGVIDVFYSESIACCRCKNSFALFWIWSSSSEGIESLLWRGTLLHTTKCKVHALQHTSLFVLSRQSEELKKRLLKDDFYSLRRIAFLLSICLIRNFQVVTK